MKLLLHACCGPCSLEPVRLLRDAGHRITIYYANSNIAPADEYAHRLETLRAWAGSEGLSVEEGRYDPEAWQASAGRIGDAALAEAREQLLDAKGTGDTAEAGESAAEKSAGSAATGARAERDADSPAESHADEDDAAAPKRGFGAHGELSLDEAASLAVDPARRAARCRACYRLRLEETARRAAEQGFDGIGTTLSVSPYQYTDIIREELERAAAQAGVAAVFEDFRPFYPEATRRSRDLGMYRQNYCGCALSDLEAAAERAERKAERKAERAAELAARAHERAAQEAARQERKAERAAYDAKQARKRAVLKALREGRSITE